MDSTLPRGGIAARGIDLVYPASGNQACRDAGITISPGEILALVGENGAGKTSLAHAVAGVVRPENGLLDIAGHRIDLARRSPGPIPGIGLVRQRGVWAPSLRVWENAALGREGRTFPRNPRKIRALLGRIIDEYGLDLDADAPAGRLDAATLQRAELAAALVANPGTLVLDEPAAAWEEGRAADFFALMSRLKGEGRSVLLVTHRLPDVFRCADSVTIMKDGLVVGAMRIQDTDPSAVALMMFGPGEDPETPGSAATGPPATADEERLRLEGVRLGRPETAELEIADLRVRAGRILGIVGLREEGLGALEDVLAGIRAPDEGEVFLDGRRLPRISPSILRRFGLAYVPADRTRRGASLTSTVAENLLLRDAVRLSRRGWLPPSRVARWAERRRREGDLDGRADQPLAELSGGNIQKVILERELRGTPRLLVVAEPAWGLDERGRRRLYRRLCEARDRGSAVVLLATDLDEALGLADDLVVVSRGRLSPLKPAGDWERQAVTGMIAGGVAAW